MDFDPSLAAARGLSVVVMKALRGCCAQQLVWARKLLRRGGLHGVTWRLSGMPMWSTGCVAQGTAPCVLGLGSSCGMLWCLCWKRSFVKGWRDAGSCIAAPSQLVRSNDVVVHPSWGGSVLHPYAPELLLVITKACCQTACAVCMCMQQ